MHSSPAPRILVVLPNNLGDVIMATPVLEGIRAAHPAACVAFLVEEGFDGGIAGNPHCDEIIRFPRKAIRDAVRAGGVAKLDVLRDALKAIASRRFDTVVNLSQHPYVSHLMPLLGAHRIVGQRFLPQGNHAVDDPWSRYLYAIPFARRCNHLHAVDVYRRIAGVTRHRGGYTIDVSDEEKSRVRDTFIGRGRGGERRMLAVFQPGAASGAKRWPLDNFVRLGRLLAGEGWWIVITGAPQERELAETIGTRIGEGVVVTAGRTSFRESIALVSCADVCVSGDTAMMHAAAACNVRVCALFGPTNPVETGPYGDGHHLFAGPCADRPCFCRECKSMLCMKSIVPETVFSCIREDRPPARPSCDVFRTRLHDDDEYVLEPVAVRGNPYFDPAASSLTRRAFEPGDGWALAEEGEESTSALERSRAFVARLEGVIESLRAYLEGGDPAMVQEFERRRGALAKLEGIGAFWTALLNIRLNSIPLLDLNAGVTASLRACREMGERVRAVVDR
jgi:ADP-heptose:LPS heptosyltransferase